MGQDPDVPETELNGKKKNGVVPKVRAGNPAPLQAHVFLERQERWQSASRNGANVLALRIRGKHRKGGKGTAHKAHHLFIGDFFF